MNSDDDQKAIPFLKWAGGKRWLAQNCSEIFPNYSGRYIEPFLGSGAIFFALRPERALLSDSNAKLIQAYKAIRDNPKLFERYFYHFAREHSPRAYYEVRDTEYRSVSRQAAQFVYLNRVCFNGIYRENLQGKFNVPLGSKTRVRLETDDFEEISALLQDTTLSDSDFETTIDSARAGDLVYADPPYITGHKYNGFVKYNQKIFSWRDQERLANSLRRARNRGVKIVLSNADHSSLRELYGDFLEITTVSRNSLIASKTAFRRSTTEIIARYV